MNIYTLTTIKETMDEPALVETKLYAKPEDAVRAYEEALDSAKHDSQFYESAEEDGPIITDTPYRWWKVYDEEGSYSSITIELDKKEVI